MSIEQSLAEIFGSLKVCPDPDPCDVEQESADLGRRDLMALLIDRGCPVLVAEAVANVDRSLKVQPLDAIKAALGWLNLDTAERGRTILVLAGVRGRGKSFAAGHVLSRHPGGVFARWANARHISNALYRRNDDPALASMLRRAESAPMLIIDDMGWEHLDQHGYIRGAFVGLLDDRIQSKLRTLITTNMNEEDFRARYGDALHDRVRGYGTWVDVKTGPSLR